VLGDPIGRHIKSVREAWNNAVKKANLGDLQLRDLRHEAGSRFDEAGMPINYVSNMLGHSNLSTTSRYLNINRRGLHLAMRNFERRHENDAGDQRREEQSDAAVAHALHKADKPTQAVVQHHADPEGRKTTLQ